MAYEFFHKLVPRIGVDETRSAAVFDREDLPDAEYGFVEMYCTEANCDCRRAIIKVISHQMPGRDLATLNYGWETAAFYSRFLHGDKLAKDAAGVTLEPLSRQSELAPALKGLFEELLLDAAYVERIKRHYGMVKNRNVSSGRTLPKMRYRRR